MLGDGLANVKHGVDRDRTRLRFAARVNDVGRVRWLVARGADVNWKTQGGRSLIVEAAWSGSVDVVRYLVSLPSIDVGEALEAASRFGLVDVVRSLVEGRGADVDMRLNHGWTALLEAAYGGHLTVIQYLLGAGADVNRATDYGWTPLHCAAMRGHLEVMRALLDAGADVTKRNSFGRTALYYANTDIATLLREHGGVE